MEHGLVKIRLFLELSELGRGQLLPRMRPLQKTLKIFRLWAKYPQELLIAGSKAAIENGNTSMWMTTPTRQNKMPNAIGCREP